VRGAVWQVLRLASIVLGVWGAARYGREFFELFPSSWGISAEVGIHVARIVVFLSVYLVMFGVTNLAQALVKKVKLGGMDRTLGALLGAGKGALFCCLVLYLQFWPLVGEVQAVHDQLHGSADGSIPASRANRFFIEHVRERVNAVVPEETRDSLQKTLDELDEAKRAADALENR
jgi:uncharacterized membrane protein required for colicin V production